MPHARTSATRALFPGFPVLIYRDGDQAPKSFTAAEITMDQTRGSGRWSGYPGADHRHPQDTVVQLSRVGYAAGGVIVVLVGAGVADAAVTYDPARAEGSGRGAAHAGQRAGRAGAAHLGSSGAYCVRPAVVLRMVKVTSRLRGGPRGPYVGLPAAAADGTVGALRAVAARSAALPEIHPSRNGSRIVGNTRGTSSIWSQSHRVFPG